MTGSIQRESCVRSNRTLLSKSYSRKRIPEKTATSKVVEWGKVAYRGTDRITRSEVVEVLGAAP